MEGQPFTLARYRVKTGREEDFMERWRDLVRAFYRLPASPLWGTLIRSRSNAQEFYAFGPWREDAHVAAMRADPTIKQAFARIAELCEDMDSGDYTVIEHVVVPR